jgi:hypothetical protein
MQIEVWTLLDGGSRLYALIHEAGIRRELIDDTTASWKVV